MNGPEHNPRDDKPIDRDEYQKWEQERASSEDVVGCGCDEYPECTHALYWAQGFNAALKGGAVIHTAFQVNPATRCWIVRRIQSNTPGYVESEIWGALSEAEAIKMAQERNSWS